MQHTTGIYIQICHLVISIEKEKLYRISMHLPYMLFFTYFEAGTFVYASAMVAGKYYYISSIKPFLFFFPGHNNSK